MDAGQIKDLGAISFPDRTSGANPVPSGKEQDGVGAPTFGEALEKALGHVDSNTRAAESAAISYVGGEDGDLHNAMLAMERADLSFRTMLQVRNKLLDAYREIMRMQV